MKKSRQKLLFNLIILSAALLLTGGYFIFFARPGQADKNKKDIVKLLPGRSRDDISLISISIRDEAGLMHSSILEKISNQWVLTSPMQKRADQGRVYQMIDDLLSLESIRILSNTSPEELTNKGIYAPSDVFTLTYRDGTSNTIINGKLATIENFYYTWVPENPDRILVTYAYRFSSAQLKPGEWAERQIFTMDLDDLGYLSVQQKSEPVIVFRLQGTNWQLSARPGQAVDPYEVKKKLLDLYSLQLNSYFSYDRQPALLAELGLTSPAYSIRIAGDAQSFDLNISIRTNLQGHYAYSPSLPGIFTVDQKDVLHHFSLNPDDYLLKRNP